MKRLSQVMQMTTVPLAKTCRKGVGPVYKIENHDRQRTNYFFAPVKVHCP